MSARFNVVLHTSFNEFEGPYNSAPPQGPSYELLKESSHVVASLPDFQLSGTSHLIHPSD